jgi:hypothetical protein
MRAMAAEVHFAIHDEHGSEILDELEQKTGVSPYACRPAAA